MKFSRYKNFQADSEEEHQKTKDKKKQTTTVFSPHTQGESDDYNIFSGARGSRLAPPHHVVVAIISIAKFFQPPRRIQRG